MSVAVTAEEQTTCGSAANEGKGPSDANETSSLEVRHAACSTRYGVHVPGHKEQREMIFRTIELVPDA
jgi:hypothetical protein